MKPLFKDSGLQRELDERGYAKLPVVLSEEILAEIQKHFQSMGIKDVFEQGYNVSMNSGDREVRRQVQAYLNSKVFEHLEPYLVDRLPYSSSYMMKEANGSIVWAHQDWSYCDETRFDSVMCWIPMCDVDEQNGAIGFIDGSHNYFDYLRGFPVPVAETPVVQHRLRLIPYFNILRMRAGEAVIFNNKTFHGSFPNYTGEERGAISMSLFPRDEPLLTYYIKPDKEVKTLLKYQVSQDFFIDYNNPRLFALYRQGRLIDDLEPIEEIPYQFDKIRWDEMEGKLASGGNERDPWKVAKTEEFYGIKIYE